MGVCDSSRDMVVRRGVAGAVGRGVRRRRRGRRRVAGGAAGAGARARPPRARGRVRGDTGAPAARHLPPCQVSVRTGIFHCSTYAL